MERCSCVEKILTNRAEHSSALWGNAAAYYYSPPIIYYNINFLFCQTLMRQLRLYRSALTAKTQKISGPIPEKIQFNLLHFSAYFASKRGVLKKYP